MSIYLKSILLIGATGSLGFGRFVIEDLIQNLPHFDRVAVLDNSSRPGTEERNRFLARCSSSGIEIVSTPGFNDSGIFTGFDTVMLFLGNHGLHLQPHIIDLAIEAGVRHIYPSEYGADLEVAKNWDMRYYKFKTLTREHLVTRGRDVPQLGWTLFMLGRLSEWALLPHFGVDNPGARAHIYGSATGRQSLLATRDAAAYVVATLKLPFESGERRRAFRISGSSPTYAEIFDTVRRVTGTTYEVTYLGIESAIREEEEARARGDVDAELSANHKLIQGLEGTLLPQPWDNSRFPGIALTSLSDTFRAAFRSDRFRAQYGLQIVPSPALHLQDADTEAVHSMKSS